MSVSDRLEYRAQEPPPGKGRNPDLVNDGAHKPPGAHGVYASSEKELGEEVLEGEAQRVHGPTGLFQPKESQAGLRSPRSGI